MGRFEGADGVGRPVWAGGLLLATKRPDSGAERRICALGDQSALLGHLSPRGCCWQRLTPPQHAVLTTDGSEDNRAPLGGSVA